MPTIEVPEDVLRKKARPGFKLSDETKRKQKDPMTPADLVRQVFHGDPKTLIRSFGSHGKARRKKFLEDKEKGIVLKRSFKRNRLGRVVMEETTANLNKPKKPKKKAEG